MITSRCGMISALRRTSFSPRLARYQANVIAQRPIDILNVQRSFSRRHVAESESCQWTLNDLESYNIHLREQNALTFFGVGQLPEPVVDAELLNVRDAKAMLQDRHAQLILYLELITMRTRHSDVPEFVVALFKLMGYTSRPWMACGRRPLHLLICGEYRHAGTAAACIVDSHSEEVLLLVQEDKYIEGEDPVIDAQAQLVAKAIAAFTENNTKRRAVGLDLLSTKAMPGIVMAGTSPTFFKIPVTETLSTHIRDGTHPPDITTVTFCQPPVPRPAQRQSEGMMPLDSRRQILSCFEAFKTVVGI